ncbi:MAG: hypothetical protein QXY45_04115 [Candidatus Aenigmatarchaeota archaeon]
MRFGVLGLSGLGLGGGVPMTVWGLGAEWDGFARWCSNDGLGGDL